MLLVFLCVHVCILGTYRPQNTCESYKTTCGSRLSPSTMGGRVIKLDVDYLCPLSPCPPENVELTSSIATSFDNSPSCISAGGTSGWHKLMHSAAYCHHYILLFKLCFIYL